MKSKYNNSLMVKIIGGVELETRETLLPQTNPHKNNTNSSNTLRFLLSFLSYYKLQQFFFKNVREYISVGATQLLFCQNLALHLSSPSDLSSFLFPYNMQILML